MYEKPIVIPAEDVAEGVYMASGAADAVGNAGSGGPKCDSIYMKGVWQAPDYSPGEKSYKERFGCMNCVAYRYNGCGLQLDYVDSNYAGSYDVDDGNRKPGWEKKGYGPDEEATDWNV